MNLIKTTLTSLVVFSLVLIAPVSSVSADRVDCFEDCEQQFKDLKKYARNGSPHAQTLLALSYKSGEIHGEIKPDQAWRWMKRAARQTYAPAQFYLSEWYRQGYHKEADEEKAMDLLQRSADKNYAPALYQMGIIKLSNEEFEEGLALVQESADAGDKGAKALLARLSGEEVPAENGNSIRMAGMVTSSVEQTGDDVITVVGSLEDPLFMFDTALQEIKDMKIYERAGTTGARTGDRKCGQPGSGCRVIKGEALQQFLLGQQ